MNIQIENLCFSYKFFGSATTPALNHIDLKIDDGEFLCLVGPSGSGKTTLLQQITGLLKPDEGIIRVDGEVLWAKSTSQTVLRRRIGLVFQFPETQLFEETVYRDVAFGPQNLGLAEEEIQRRVRDALQSVYLDFDEFQDRSPFSLSEGEKRRVAIAGVLAMQPEMLILDEPTAGLDYSGVQAVLKSLRHFHDQGKSVLLVTHNLDLAAAIVERIVVISEGRIRFDGHKRDLLGNQPLLQSVGLALPRLQLIVQRLKQMGWVKSDEIYSLEELKKAIADSLQLKSGEKKQDSFLYDKV